MKSTLERTNTAATPKPTADRISWSGVLYGHMMPGLPLIASRLAAEQRRRPEPRPSETTCIEKGETRP
jgi:hypothetical protein